MIPQIPNMRGLAVPHSASPGTVPDGQDDGFDLAMDETKQAEGNDVTVPDILALAAIIAPVALIDAPPVGAEAEIQTAVLESTGLTETPAASIPVPDAAPPDPMQQSAIVPVQLDGPGEIAPGEEMLPPAGVAGDQVAQLPLPRDGEPALRPDLAKGPTPASSPGPDQQFTSAQVFQPPDFKQEHRQQIDESSVLDTPQLSVRAGAIAVPVPRHHRSLAEVVLRGRMADASVVGHDFAAPTVVSPETIAAVAPTHGQESTDFLPGPSAHLPRMGDVTPPETLSANLPEITLAQRSEQPRSQPPLAAPIILQGALVSAAAVSHQIVSHHQAASSGPVEILLQPAELGHVKFHIHQQGDAVRVVLTVERPETLELMRRNTDQLIQEFRAAGFSDATLSFGHWGQREDGPAEQFAAMPDDIVEPDTPLLPRNLPVPLPQGTGSGLNLRL